ncbi:MAG: DUF5702 domain-containing protein [Lachnospiraceae bacterium]|nr:DUF5702 domain-containing protein [Lachnospiraceae bacterium]
MSVFLGLMLSMVMSLFFTMAESVRYSCLQTEAKTMTATAVQSAFGEYNRPLWDEYGLLAIDMDYGQESCGTQQLEETIQYYLGEDGLPNSNGVDFLKLSTQDCRVDETMFLTDGEGAVLIQEAAKCVESELTKEGLDELLNRCSVFEEASKNTVDIEDVLSNTKKNLEETQEGNKTDEEGGVIQTLLYKDHPSGLKKMEDEKEAEGNDESKNFIGSIMDFEHKAVLSQITGDTSQLSDQSFTVENLVSNRELQTGSIKPKEVTILNRVLFQYYLTKHFSCYGNDVHKDGMKYELEYILCGHPSDIENLTSTVKKLLLIREVENLVSLGMDKEKVAEAKALAATASAVILHPELEELVSYGIMAAWAYIESVLDVRLLLSGGKVSLIKTPGEWTSSLKEIGLYLDTNVKAKECEKGITYQEYLFALYTLESQKVLSYRALDLMEENLHQKEDYEFVSMDHFLVEADCQVTLRASLLFISFIPLYQGDLSGYTYCIHKRGSYL